MPVSNSIRLKYGSIIIVWRVGNSYHVTSLAWRKCHYLITKELDHGSVTIIFSMGEFPHLISEDLVMAI